MSQARNIVAQVQEIQNSLGLVVVPAEEYLEKVGAVCTDRAEGVWQMEDGSVLVIKDFQVTVRKH